MPEQLRETFVTVSIGISAPLQAPAFSRSKKAHKCARKDTRHLTPIQPKTRIELGNGITP
ncbi:MAG: hypothetical protein OHK0052_21830 [Anaerolineales bacterium]